MGAPNLEILAYDHGPLGPLCLRRRALLGRPGTVVVEVTLNYELLMSSVDNESERALARRALDMHPARELDVLIGGLGLGYTARETLACERVARVEVIEYLPQVRDWLRRGLIPLADELNADSRLAVVGDDVFARLAGAPAHRHDLILIDVDHAPDYHLATANASFYGEAGLALAREHLAPGGVLGVWSAAPSQAFGESLGQVFADVRIESVRVVNEIVDEEQTHWLFFARR